MAVYLASYDPTRAPTDAERADLLASILAEVPGFVIVSTMDENMQTIVPALLYLIQYSAPLPPPPP
jgi:hypothetical protein